MTYLDCRVKEEEVVGLERRRPCDGLKSVYRDIIHE